MQLLRIAESAATFFVDGFGALQEQKGAPLQHVVTVLAGNIQEQ